MSGYGPPRGWRGSNAWAAAPSQRPTEDAVGGDYMERLTAFLNHHEAQPWSDTVLLLSDDSDVPDLDVSDLRAALDELERLRAERAELGDTENQWRIVSPNGPIHSFTERDLDDRANWLPGVRLEQRTVYGTPWTEPVPQQPELPDRQAKLLAAFRREGGDWSPLRAREEMVRCGYAVTSERAHQIMKQLAERGYLEQVRPRAYTYRLKAEAPQQPERGGEQQASPEERS